MTTVEKLVEVVPVKIEGRLPTLAGCLNLDDIERAAEVLLKPKAWAYYASAADDEKSELRSTRVLCNSVLTIVDCPTSQSVEQRVFLSHSIPTPCAEGRHRRRPVDNYPRLQVDPPHLHRALRHGSASASRR